MIRFLKNMIIKKANKIMNSRDPDFFIGSVYDPYMLRWWVIPRNRFFNIYLHEILHDDDDRAMHDHPWPSLSLMIDGGVFETYTQGDLDDFGQRIDIRRWVGKGEWVYRGPNFVHRLELADYGTPAPAKTIFITGPRIREWGFLCPNGWRHWKDFVSMEHKGQAGIGCGEVTITNDKGVFNSFHCKECGHEEIQLHNYDSFCRNCVESSSYARHPIDWTVPAVWVGGVMSSTIIWTALLIWWFS